MSFNSPPDDSSDAETTDHVPSASDVSPKGAPPQPTNGPSTGLQPPATQWIDFWMPTSGYRNNAGEHLVLVRLTVVDGRFAITAPAVYPRGSLGTASDHSSDGAGGAATLQLVRPNGNDRPQIDLVIAADGEVTAVLQMDSLGSWCRDRQAIVPVITEFVIGIDMLDFAIDHIRLWRS